MPGHFRLHGPVESWRCSNLILYEKGAVVVKNAVVSALFLAVFTSIMTPVHAQEGKFSRINLLGDSAIPIGNFQEYNAFGFGGTMQFLYPVNSQISIGGTFGFLRFRGREPAVEFPLVIYIVKTPPMNAIPMLGTVQYTFPITGTVKPYLNASLGFYRLHANRIDKLFNPGDLTGDGVDDTFHYVIPSFDQTKPGGMLASGVLIELSPNRLWFEVRGAYHMVATKNQSTKFLNLGIGLNVAFSRSK